MMELNITKEINNTTMILKLQGILDITTASVIEEEMDEMDSIEILILDFANIEFIDSTGIGSIVNLINLSQEKSFKIKLKGISELNHQVFNTVGLYTILYAMQGEVI